MFSAIKKLFVRKAAAETYTRVPESEPAFEQAVLPPSAPQPVPRAVPAPARRPYTPKPVTGSTLSLPLKAILSGLNPEAMRLVRLLDVGDAAILLPMQDIVSQIPRGSVKIAFGQLRAASPPGVFAEDNVLDETLVELPLQEVICRLDPALLSKRPAQRQVVVPAEVAGPFGNYEKKTAAASATPTAPARGIASVKAAVPKAAEPAAKPVVRIRATPSSVPASAAPVAAPAVARAQPAPLLAQSIPAKSFDTSKLKKNPPPGSTPVQVPLPEVLNRAAAPAPVETAPRVFTPIDPAPNVASTGPSAPAPISMGDFTRNVTPQTPITPISPDPLPEPTPIRFQTAPVLPEPPPAPVPDGRLLTVALAELSAAWPDAVQKEIAAHYRPAATVNLPLAMIEVALKQGKVSLPWRVLRSWVQPVAPSGPSASDAALLDLPLKVITPLFLAEMKTAKQQKKIVIDPAIPDLFSGGTPADKSAAVGAPEAAAPEIPPVLRAPVPPPAFQRSSSLPPAPLAAESQAPVDSLPVNSGLAPKKVSDTNYFGKTSGETTGETAAPAVHPGGAPSTAFLKRYATPNEIVAKTMAIEGVAGALIALPDGLLVASQIPASMNAETIAAFLPQLYGKVSQCTRELRLGDLNNLNFTVGQIPWKIYKVGAIYFAAFGHAGAPLPTAQIAAVAGELDRNGR